MENGPRESSRHSLALIGRFIVTGAALVLLTNFNGLCAAFAFRFMDAQNSEFVQWLPWLMGIGALSGILGILGGRQFRQGKRTGLRLVNLASALLLLLSILAPILLIASHILTGVTSVWTYVIAIIMLSLSALIIWLIRSLNHPRILRQFPAS